MRDRLVALVEGWWPPVLRQKLYDWQQLADRLAAENSRYLGGLEEAARDIRTNPVPINIGKALDRIEVALQRDTRGFDEGWSEYRRARDGSPLRVVGPRSRQGTAG